MEFACGFIEGGVERVLGFSPMTDLVADEVDKLRISILDDHVLHSRCRVLAGPGDLPGGPVTIQAGAAGGDPVPQQARASAKSRCHPSGADPFWSGS